MSHLSTSPKTSAQQVLDRIDAFGGRLGKLENAYDGLLKAVEKNANRKGVRPQDLIADETQGGRLNGFFDPQGIFHPIQPTFGSRKSMGDGAEQYLKALAFANSSDPATPIDRRRWALDYLGKGIPQRMRDGRISTYKTYGEDGAVLKTAMAESVSGSVGGYVIPPAFLEQLQLLQIENQFIRPRAFKQPMSTLTLQIPSLDMTTVQAAGTTPFLGGVKATWTAEAATRAESEPKFRQTELKANELSFYAVASNTFLADQAVGLDSLLTQIFSWAIGWYTEYAYLQGTGVGQPLGILNAPATISVTRGTAATVQLTDIMNMVSKLYWMLRAGADVCWAFHPSAIPFILQLNDQSSAQTLAHISPGGTTQAGRFAWIDHQTGAQMAVPEAGGLGAQSFGTIIGFPAFVTEKLPAIGTTGAIILIDASKYVLGDRLDTQVDISPHVNFLQNQTVWRIVWRGDGQPWLNNPVTLADGTYTVSPFIQLTQ